MLGCSTTANRPQQNEPRWRRSIISDELDHRRLPALFCPTTFETTTFTVGSIDSTVAALLIYRPGSAVVTDAFFTELTTYKCQILVAGDSNIHTERAGDADAGRLHEILQSFDCIQQVLLTPTRRSGGTLDLIVTKSEQVLADMTVDPADISSDHSVISWCFLLLLRGERLVQSEQGQFPCCTA